MESLQTIGVLGPDAEQEWLGGIGVADYPKREFSFGDIKRASSVLSRHISEEDRHSDDVLRAFAVAHNWRMAHALPMITERRRLALVATGGLVTAGRVKRMASIRKKLMNTTIGLRDMQDLGGCRAVMAGRGGVGVVLRELMQGNYRSRPTYVSDYLTKPKPDGYRGVHVVVDFAGAGQSEPYTGQRIEIQIRTRLQHSWSTAVEIVGAVTNQDFKGGGGDPRWRRFLALMSDYYALCDGFALQHDGPQTESRLCREIQDAGAEIGALELVTGIRDAMERYVVAPTRGPMYMLSMDAVSRSVSAVRRDGIMIADDNDFDEVGDQTQSVIVSVDRSADLRQAFPNFYLDIAKFTMMVGRALNRRKLRLTYKPDDIVPEFQAGRIR
jgi:ppGpp synthetase/RelA/SpoT-type nucleotidyltranferase